MPKTTRAKRGNNLKVPWAAGWRPYQKNEAAR
jgi:hypothetical protein